MLNKKKRKEGRNQESNNKKETGKSSRCVAELFKRRALVPS